MSEYSIIGDWLARAVNACTCYGGGDHNYGHEPGCGYEPLARVEELRASGIGIVNLPASPSEYWGPAHQPQWNHYPFTRVDGDEIEIGARAEDVYRIDVAEARIFAADVLMAAEIAGAARE
ncbi:hypothetical protein [Mycobacterium phage WXIN]|nr:hypothetical protein [Mycobacterium phage WXIN]